MTKKLSNNQSLLRGFIEREFNRSDYTRVSDYFEFFAADKTLKEDELSADDINLGLMGRSGDGGCDGAYLFCNSELVHEDEIKSVADRSREAQLRVVIIQAKNELSFNENVIMKWKTLASNVLDFDKELFNFRDRYDSRLIDFFAMFRRLRQDLMGKTVSISFEFVYVSLGEEVHPNVLAQEAELKEEIQKLFPEEEVHVRHIGAKELMTLVNSAPTMKLSLPLADIPIALGERKDYVALVKLNTYYKFISDDNGNIRKSIFESNVRDYQGYNNVNKAIQHTLSANDKDDFWWLNNGVTIIASDAIQETSKRLLITDPEIVNGLQTSNEIFSFFKNNPDKLDMEYRNILVRVIVAESESSRDKIILATNSQTSIPAVALRTTDAIHRNIEMCLKYHGLYYDRRKNYYRNQGKRPSEIVSVAFLGQCLMSIFKSAPNTARARPSTLLNDDNHYAALYSNDIGIQVYWRSAELGKRVERFIKGSDLPRGDQNDILFYVLYFLVASICQKTDITFADFMNIDFSAIEDEQIQSALDQVYNLYRDMGGNSKVAKGSKLILSIRETINS